MDIHYFTERVVFYLHKNSRAKIFGSVPPIRWAWSRTTSAQNTLVKAVQLGPVFYRLQILGSNFSRFILTLQPWLNRRILLVKIGHVRYQIFHHVHMRQRIDFSRLGAIRINFAGMDGTYCKYYFKNWYMECGLKVYLIHARVLTPPMFMEHDPQMPSRQDRLNVSVGSISFLILMRASKIMGAQVSRSTLYSCMVGFLSGWSGFHR